MCNSSTLQRLIEFSVARSIHKTHCFRHYSYILDGNKILSIGENNPDKTHPLAYRFAHRFNCIHSELSAIVSFAYPHERLRRAKMVNIRISRTGVPRMAKPCGMCFNMLSAFGIKECIFTNRLGEFETLRI